MADDMPAHPFKVGDRVKIRDWPKLRARIVEERGPLGPGGALIYRIRIAGKWKHPYAEVREDQLIAIPPTPEGEPGSSGRRNTESAPRRKRRPEAEALTTGAEKSPQPLKVGDRVNIRYSDQSGRIVEERGALGPGGMLVYRVRIPRKPKPVYVEFTEDQLIAIPPTPNGEPTPSTRRRARGKPKVG